MDKKVEVGQQVIFVDGRRNWYDALVTIVWGECHYEAEAMAKGHAITVPCLNLVFVSKDESKDDQYGRQIERETSVVHFSDMTAPGNCWLHNDEADEAKEKFAKAELAVNK